MSELAGVLSPEGGGLRCPGDAHGSPGRDWDPSQAAGLCHRPSCFDTGVSRNLSDVDRGREGRAVRPARRVPDYTVITAQPDWLLLFPSGCSVSEQIPDVMSSHLSALQGAFQEEKPSCQSKLGADGEAQAGITPR